MSLRLRSSSGACYRSAMAKTKQCLIIPTAVALCSFTALTAHADNKRQHAYVGQHPISQQASDGYCYIGVPPPAYVEAKPIYAPGNRVYASIEFKRPVVEIDVPPVGYAGPVVEIHGEGRNRRRGRGDSHVTGHVGVGVDVHIDVPAVEVGIGVPGVVIVDDHHHGHKKPKTHKKFKKHKGWKR